MTTVSKLDPAGNSTGEWLKLSADMEHEQEAAPVPLDRMTESELMAVALHDEDVSQRRAAVRMLLLNLRLECEQRVMAALREVRK